MSAPHRLKDLADVIELVRALLHEPKLLLMDEATVGLDPKSRQDLIRAVTAVVRERACSVLWATHWVEEVAHADRVLVLHQGRAPYKAASSAPQATPRHPRAWPPSPLDVNPAH